MYNTANGKANFPHALPSNAGLSLDAGAVYRGNEDVLKRLRPEV
jgi:hypothetical protein